MDKLHKPRGGARPNSGRKPIINKIKSRTFGLNDADWLKLKLLGGAKWIREQLAKV